MLLPYSQPSAKIRRSHRHYVSFLRHAFFTLLFGFLCTHNLGNKHRWGTLGYFRFIVRDYVSDVSFYRDDLDTKCKKIFFDSKVISPANIFTPIPTDYVKYFHSVSLRT